VLYSITFIFHKISLLQIGPSRHSIFGLRVCLEFSQLLQMCKIYMSDFCLHHEICNLEFVYSCCTIKLFF